MSKMITFIKFLCFLMLVQMLKVSCAPTPPPQNSPPPSQNSPPSLYVVAFQWPTTLCKIQHCPKGIPPVAFRLHGLWPSHANGTSITDCQGQPFSGSALQDIRNDLLFYWPSYILPENQFWAHEWAKHGTCSGMSLVNYFKQAMDLSRQMYSRLITALAAAGIAPSTATRGGYTIKKYIDAVVTALHIHPQIQCTTYRGNKYLLEIRLCVDNQFQFHNCSKQNQWLYGCGRYGEIDKTQALLPSTI